MNKLKANPWLTWFTPSSIGWLLLATFSVMVAPTAAFADPSTGVGFTPPSSDYSVSYLENLFGNVDGVLYGTGSQMMGAIFKVFNGAVLALGGIVITYTLLVGTMNTAQEGKMLGQKWSSIWVPIRSTVGLALLLPKTSGYCLMQIFVMWIVVQGVGAADKVWNAALDYLNAGGVIIRANINTETGTSGDTNAMSTGAVAILGGQVCMIGLQKTLETVRQSYLDAKETGAGPCIGEPSPQMQAFCDTPVPHFIDTVNALAYQGAADKNAYLAGGTGYQTTFNLPMPYYPTDSTSPYAYLNKICGYLTWNAIPEATLDDISGSVSGLSSQDNAATRMSRATAIQQMFLDLVPTAELIVENNPKLTPKANDSLTPAYPFAKTVLGVPYLSSGTNACTKYSSDCVIWGGAYGSTDTEIMYSALLHGDEIDNAVAAYNAVMASTVALINDANNSTN
ncbi:MAG TPA: type IV secretion protein DotA, partial [Legionella sp.]|nr:type IV secretion protein DotA [Legionella sp.]